VAAKGKKSKKSKKPRDRKAGKNAQGSAAEKGGLNPFAAFNSTVLTLVGAYTTTGSIIVTCGAGLVAVLFIVFLTMK